MTRTHEVHVTLCDTGKWLKVHLWADGDGRKAEGYVTSLSLLNAELREHLTYDHVDLYYVTKEGKSQKIRSDRKLKEAVEYLPDEGVLSATAIRREEGRHLYPSPKADGKKVRFNIHNVETDEESVDAIVKRFFGECDYCYNSALYTYIPDDEYHLCAECYSNMSSEDRGDWAYRTGWKTTVPEAPLSKDDPYASDEVRHLQYLLTRLGLMSLSATDRHVGSYQGYTARAVQEFRERHDIVGRDMEKYDEKTAKVLRRVIRQLREDGHEHL